MTAMKMKIISTVLCLVLVLISLASCNFTGSPIKSEADLVNKKIGVIEGSETGAFAEKYTENGCEILKYSSYISLEEAFAQGKIDCAILDENFAKARASVNNTLEILPGTLGEGTYSFAAVKSKKVYNVMLNKALDVLIEDGTVDNIVNGYLNDYEYEYDFAQESDGSNGSFTIAIDPGAVPYVFPADESHENPRGISIALVDALCSSLGIEYTYLTVASTSLADALRMGVADFAIGAFDFKNDVEGNEEILQSTVLLTYNHVIVVKK